MALRLERVPEPDQRLADNWSNGKCINFPLPSPDHPGEAHADAVYNVKYDGRFVVSASRDKSICVWSVATKRLVVPPLLGHEASVLCVQFDPCPEEDIIISSGVDCHIIMWQFSTGKGLRIHRNAHASWVLCLQFDGRYLVTGSKDKTVKLWDRKSIGIAQPDRITTDAQLGLSLLATLSGHTAAVNAVAIRGDRIVSAAGDGSIRMWNYEGDCLKIIKVHTKGVCSLDFDGRFTVTGSSDMTIRVCNLESEAEVECFSGHSDLVRIVKAIKYSHGNLQTPGSSEESDTTDIISSTGPQWDRIVSGAYDATVIIWRKDIHDHWVVSHQLHLKDALQHLQLQVRNKGSKFNNLNSSNPAISRVFSLQFDERRIICSSHFGIAGWDFANGDQGVEAIYQ
jgi:F-box and WD-40 domain protein 1/11